MRLTLSNKLFAIANFILIALILCSCDFFKSKLTKVNTLTLPISIEPSELDPRKASDSTSALIIRHLYDGITRIDYKGNPQLSLARHVTISPDRKIYTFYLREAYWSNGDRIIADDFIRTWKQVLDPNFLSENAYHLYVIKGAREVKQGLLPASHLGLWSPNDWTLEIELTYPLPYFLELLSFDAFFPVHRNTPSSSLMPSITCGPFSLKKWQGHNELILEKNPRYWDAINVHLNEIHFQHIPDEMTALSLFEKGEVDWVGSPLTKIPNEAHQSYLAQDGIVTLQDNFAYWIVLNTKVSPFHNKNIRKAFSLAINREAITYALQGLQTPARQLLPPGLSPKKRHDYFEDSPLLAYSYFKKGIEELGIDLHTFPTVTFYFNQSEVHKRIASMLQEQWRKELGIVVNMQVEEWGSLMSRLRSGKFQMARYGWRAQYTDPINFLEIFQSPEKQISGGYNFSQWSNPEYDSSLDKIHELYSGNGRNELVLRAEKQIMDELPIIPLFFDSLGYLISPKLHNAVITSNGRIDFKWAFLEKKH